jgi:hypothetical protein
MKLYLAIQVGCMECGVETKTLGIFASESEAKKRIDKVDTWKAEGGDGYGWLVVIDTTKIEIVKDNE